MSDPSDLQGQPHEREEILRFVISFCLNLSIEFKNFTFRSIDDGGMGSFLCFCNNIEDIKRSEKILFSEAEFFDEDGIDVFIEFYRISNFYFEVNFWKVDFSMLKSFPNSNSIINIKCIK